MSRFREKPVYGFFLLCLSALALLSGGLGVYWFGQRADREYRSTLMDRTAAVSVALSPRRVATLTGTASDLTNPDYVRLKEQLAGLRHAVADIRFCYLVRRRGDEIVILCDSECSDAEACSPPGQVYEEATEEFRAAVDSGVCMVVGPGTDRWGTWMSGVAPIRDETGQVIAALGLDIAAADWASHTARARVVPVLVSVLLSAFLLLLYAMQRRERKAAEALAQSEEKYRNIFENSPVGLYRTTPEGAFIDVNSALARLHGYASPDDMKASVLDIGEQMYVDRGDRTRLREILAREGAVTGFDVKLCHKDGRRIWGRVSGREVRDAEGAIVYYEGAIEDITERKEAEEKLKNTQSLLLAALEHSPAGILIADAPEVSLRYLNTAALAIHGTARASAVGTTADIRPDNWQVFHPDGTPYRTEELPLFQAVRHGTITHNVDTFIRRPSGEKRCVLVNAAPVRDSTGEITAGILVFLDVTERIQAEDALRESERRLEAIIQGCPIPQFVIDRNHQVILWNKALEMYSGVLASDVLGTTQQWRAFYSEERPCLADLLVEGNAEGILHWYGEKCQPSRLIPDAYEMTDFLPLMIGGGQWLHFTAALIRDASGAVVGAIETLEDVGEAKRAEEELRKSEAKFARAFHTNAAVMSITSAAEGRFVDVNESFLKTFGYTEEQVIGKSIQELGLWYDPAQREAIVREVYDRGYVRDAEVIVCGRTGELHNGLFSADLIDVSGVPHLLVVLLDITERKKAQNALLRQVAFDALATRLLARFASALGAEIDGEIRAGMQEIGGFFGVEMVCVALVSPDLATWDMAYAWRDPAISGTTADYQNVPMGTFAWSEGQSLSGNIIQMDTLDDLPPEAVAERQVLQSEGVQSMLQVPLRGMGAGMKGAVCLRSCACRRNWSPEDVQHLGMLADTIASALGRKHAEAERIRLEGQLMHAQRMESVGRLAGGVAHDFNNMLAVILGHGEIMIEDLPPDSSLRADLADIMSAGERAKSLTRQLLAFSRKQLLDMKSLDLNEVVGGMKRMIERLLGEDIEIRVLATAASGHIRADRSQMEQILLNLCVNARDAMPDGGKLTIETGDAMLDEHYVAVHPGVRPGPYVMLSVSDTGCGMDEETQRQVFDPFFTTKEKGKGTGLGLSTVFGIVKQHGGEISVYSELARGTTFKVFLPQEQGPADALPTGNRDAVIPGHGEVILVVEDEAAVRKLTCQMLTRLGYTVVEADTPGECIELARCAERIDLLLTDVVMPGMTGPQVRNAVAASRPGIRTLFMSGYTENVIAHHGVLDAGIHFISKPFTEKGLSVSVREALYE